MHRSDVRIRSREGAEFDCYMAAPRIDRPAPAIVLASAIHGVDDDLRAIADSFALEGYIAAAPDLFWRTLPGPLPRDDARGAQRAQPRLARIKAGERDLADVLSALHAVSGFSGRAAVIGFCYGGPYAILGPARLGYAAGIACHGTQMLDFIGAAEATTRPLCLLWGDRDEHAPPEVLEAYRRLAARKPNVVTTVMPGVRHGYMLASGPAFDPGARHLSMQIALEVLGQLARDVPNGG